MQLLCLEERLSPQVLSALEEDSQMGRLLACRSLSVMLTLIGRSMNQDTLNKIYPGKLESNNPTEAPNYYTKDINLGFLMQMTA